MRTLAFGLCFPLHNADCTQCFIVQILHACSTIKEKKFNGSVVKECSLSVVYCFRDPELAKKIGAAVALEVRATGIPFIFAPFLAVRNHDLTMLKLSLVISSTI